MDSSTHINLNTHEEITSYIDKLSFELKKFSKLLTFENNALLNRNYDEVTQAAEEKTFLITNIQRIDNALKSVFNDNQKESTLQDYIKAMPNGNKIKVKWIEQMRILDKCTEQNKINKKLVDQYINDIHSIVDILDMNNNPQVYAKNGLKVYSNPNSASYSQRI